MDAHSVAATAVNGEKLTGADELGYDYTCPTYQFDPVPYEKRVYQGFGCATTEEPIIYGPNIKDWPELPKLNEHMLLKVAAFITDEVTTTDELIPSGETASFRSNPMGLAQFTLSRRCPEYVKKATWVMDAEKERKDQNTEHPVITKVLEKMKTIAGFEGVESKDINLSSTIYATKPGDGSAREQAASCQRVLLGGANICQEYATKRYRSNLINWGMVPFTMNGEPNFQEEDYILREAYELAKQSPGTIVTDMPVHRGEEFGLDKEAKVLLFNDGAVTGRYATARRIAGEPDVNQEELDKIAMDAIYESRWKTMYHAQVYVGLDSEFMVKAHLLIPKGEENIMYSWMLNFQYLSEEYVKMYRDSLLIGEGKEADIYLFSDPHWDGRNRPGMNTDVLAESIFKTLKYLTPNQRHSGVGEAILTRETGRLRMWLS